MSDDPSTNEVLSEQHYYPFATDGILGRQEPSFHGAWMQNPGKGTKYQYNGKELNEDFGLDWHDYGTRWYDVSIGRWNAVDPLSEEYYSISLYNYGANNPLINIDPDGREIVFYQWDPTGGEDMSGEYIKTTFDKLDPKMQRALAAFAKTDEGYAFFQDFASAGDKIGEVEFREAGRYSGHTLNFSAYLSETSAEGFATPPVSDNKGFASFYMNINYREERAEEDIALTIGHEAFIHLYQYLDEFAYQSEVGGRDEMEAIITDRRKNNPKGIRDHRGYINDKPEYNRFKMYVNQLKKIFGSERVNQAKKAHDEKY